MTWQGTVTIQLHEEEPQVIHVVLGGATAAEAVAVMMWEVYPGVKVVGWDLTADTP